jgi:hypothetical protein
MVLEASDSSVLPGNPLGYVLRVAGGVGVVIDYGGPYLVVNFTTPPGLMPNTNGLPIIPPQAAGEWSLTAPVSVVGGLDHLNGCTVAVVADGSETPVQTVIDGCITLAVPASNIVAGQPFSAQIMTLPLNNGPPANQARRGGIPAVTMRTLDTRGIAVGPSFSMLTEEKERTDENFGQPIQMEPTLPPMPPVGWIDEGGASTFVGPVFPPLNPDGSPPTELQVYQSQYATPLSPGGPGGATDRRIVLDPQYQQGNAICIAQLHPLPAHILALIPEETDGDTPSP